MWIEGNLIILLTYPKGDLARKEEVDWIEDKNQEPIKTNDCCNMVEGFETAPSLKKTALPIMA